MFLSFYLLLQPFAAVADPIPIVGDLVEFGVCFISGILGFVSAGIVIGCAWLAYRPILASCLFVGLIAIVVGIVLLSKKRRKERQGQLPQEEILKDSDDEEENDIVEVPEANEKMEEP